MGTPLDFTFFHRCWWTIEHTKTLAEILAYAAAFIFFGYKVIVGYFVTEMGLTISCKRAHSVRTGFDHLAVIATLKKGNKGTLRLHDAQARIVPDGAPPQFLELIGVERLTFKKDKLKWPGTTRRKIDWTLSESKPFLRLAPGDQAQFSCHCSLPKDALASVEVVVLGQRLFTRSRGQWRSSSVSLPIQP